MFQFKLEAHTYMLAEELPTNLCLAQFYTWLDRTKETL